MSDSERFAVVAQQLTELIEATRDDLLALIRNAHGGFPYAIALGDEDDDDTVWVALDRATDADLRFYLAFKAVRPLCSASD